MHDFAIARTRFGLLNVHIPRKAGINFKVLIFIRPAGFELECFGNRQHQIRLPDAPALCEAWHGRQILRAAFRSAAVYPRGDGVNFSLRQTRIISPLPEMRIGMPWRHFTADDFFLDGFRPRAYIFVAQHRKRRSFARAMTFRATFEKDRRDVFGKSDSGFDFPCRTDLRCPIRPRNGAQGNGEDECNSFHSDFPF